MVYHIKPPQWCIVFTGGNYETIAVVIVRERERETDRQTHRQTDRYTNRHTDKDKQTYTEHE